MSSFADRIGSIDQKDHAPLYRQLQQSYPQNVAYAAMAHVLEQKVATATKSGAQP